MNSISNMPPAPTFLAWILLFILFVDGGQIDTTAKKAGFKKT